MAIVAQALPQDDFIIPLPITIIPGQTSGDINIIVAVLDFPPNQKQLSSVFKFYGKESCSQLHGRLPNNPEKDVVVICVKVSTLISMSSDQNLNFPSSDISPLWSEDRFGISADEAEVIAGQSKETSLAIHLKMRKFKKILETLKIRTDHHAIDLIRECHSLIKEAQAQMQEAMLRHRRLTAEVVADFMQANFDVFTWVDNNFMPDPVVRFYVLPPKTDREAVVIGKALEGMMNIVDYSEIDKYFDEFEQEACCWPIVIDTSFDEDGSRILSKEEAYRNPNAN